ncbi:hypothetical protein GCM10009560_43020 [Nonomuraea longicatena]|uniref:Uncharacterized protein n=1 Tax=Nonomuraea longicatena TaxID=83682 RepID=A0ABP4ADM4_9ACTN
MGLGGSRGPVAGHRYRIFFASIQAFGVPTLYTMVERTKERFGRRSGAPQEEPKTLVSAR